MMRTVKNIIILNDIGSIEGGAEKIAIETACIMKKKGYRVIFFCASQKTENALVKSGVEIINLNMEYLTKPKSKSRAAIQCLWNTKAYNSLIEVLCQLDIGETVVHIHSWTKALSPSVFFALARKRAVSVITMHEYFLVCPNGTRSNYNTREICDYKDLSLKCILCNCDKDSYIHKIYRVIKSLIQNYGIRKSRPFGIFISDFSKEKIVPYLRNMKNTYRVNNCVEINKRKTRVLAEENKWFVYMGRVSEEKGVHLFCEALSRLGLPAVVIGDGPLRTGLEKKYTSIIFTGWLSGREKEKWVNRAKCLVLTSLWYETMGLVVLEMQSAGIPCVVPEQCAASEYIKHMNTGVIYRMGDIDSLISALRYFEDSSLVMEMSNNAFERKQNEQYTEEVYGKEIENVYINMLNESD